MMVAGSVFTVLPSMLLSLYDTTVPPPTLLIDVLLLVIDDRATRTIAEAPLAVRPLPALPEMLLESTMMATGAPPPCVAATPANDEPDALLPKTDNRTPPVEPVPLPWMPTGLLCTLVFLTMTLKTPEPAPCTRMPLPFAPLPL